MRGRGRASRRGPRGSERDVSQSRRWHLPLRGGPRAPVGSRKCPGERSSTTSKCQSVAGQPNCRLESLGSKIVANTSLQLDFPSRCAYARRAAQRSLVNRLGARTLAWRARQLLPPKLRLGLLFHILHSYAECMCLQPPLSNLLPVFCNNTSVRGHTSHFVPLTRATGLPTLEALVPNRRRSLRHRTSS